METILYSFDPNHGNSNTTLWVAIIITLISLAILIFLLRRKVDYEKRNQNLLIAMLTFFVFLIATGTSFFSFWEQQKIGPVLIFENAISTPYGKADFQNIRNAHIEVTRQKSWVNPQQGKNAVQLLIIEEKNKKVHVLSELNYDIITILGSLRETIGKWKESSNG